MTTLDEVECDFTLKIGHKPHSIQQMLSYCKQNSLSFTFKEIREWWPNRPEPEDKPNKSAMNSPGDLYSVDNDNSKINHDRKAQHCVTGYIRHIMQTARVKIPNVIIDLCLMFYKHTEYFHAVGDMIKSEQTSNDRLISNTTSTVNTAYGATIINLRTDTNSIYKWTVKLKYFDPSMEEIDWGGQQGPVSAMFNIGIDAKPIHSKSLNGSFYQMYVYNKYSVNSQKVSDPNYSMSANGDYCHYLDGGSGRWGAYHFKEINDGDTITMELNTEERTIKYHKNGVNNDKLAFQGHNKDLAIEFEGADCEYRFAVAVKEASIELISFEHEDIDLCNKD